MTTGPNDSRRPHRPGRRAFTLLELILVMVIISTVLAMAAPSLRGFFGSRRTEEVARRLLALTQLARTLSVTEGRPYRLNFSDEQGTFWLTVQDGGAFVAINSEFGRVFILPEGVEADWEDASGSDACTCVTFYPEGRSDVATIRLIGRQGQAFDVACVSPTEGFQVIQRDKDTL